MVSRGRKEAALRTHKPKRRPKHRILIVSEGKATEKDYFQYYQEQVRNPLVHVEMAKETGVPKTVVEIAIRERNNAAQTAKAEKDENLLWDEVWAVFDVDEHPHLEEAITSANKENITMAISNPCFELWLLLHFKDQRASIHRHNAQSDVKTFLRDYGKALDDKNLALIYQGYAHALKRAQSLDAEALHHEAMGRNPTTGVYRLTESIRAGGSS